MSKEMTSYIALLTTDNILNQDYPGLEKFEQCFSNWHQKCTSQEKQNDTYYVITMATLVAPVSFCEKPNIHICNPLK